MLPTLRPLIAFVLAPAAFAAAENCCGSAGACCPAAATAGCALQPMATSATEARRHPLRGVITAVHADKSALMVKHEEIPGVMRAMTMLFKVDADTLKSVQKGQAITGMMSRQGNEWWLHDVKVVAAKKA